MSEQPALLLAKSIVKSFGATSVLRSFDLSVSPGEVHAFLGGNGAGKSTFINNWLRVSVHCERKNHDGRW
ncbi:ATP-binding cassette domain-containing protein [Paraburkholderia sp. A1RI-2L]|uniref:ATP-binding cassette domain-containing protein n=1 Tax=Paraburkholderia sp. A1RI-2L TaxID=3028367 RepID=UPI003BA3CC88